MEWKKPTWFDEKTRWEQLDHVVDETDRAHFGYRTMPTGKKPTGSAGILTGWPRNTI